MAHEIISPDDLESFRRRLLEDIRALLVEQHPGDPKKEWLRSAEVRKMLGISHGTLQNLRVRGALPYRKIGGLIYYRSDDIESLLSSPSKRGKN